MTLTFDHVREALLSTFPEVREWATSTFGPDYDLDEEAPEEYPLFEDVVQRLLFEFLEDGKHEAVLPRLFRFFESMSNSCDRTVTDLLGIAIVEPLVFKRESVRQAWKYMGAKTKELTISEARHQGRLNNLPPDAQPPAS